MMRISRLNSLWFAGGVALGREDSGALLHPAACAISPWLSTPDSAVCTLSWAAVGRNQSAIATPAPEQSRWIKSSLCQKLDGNNFCAYTDLSFNNGEGVSILTTPETIAELVSERAFRGNRDESSIRKRPETTAPYRDAEIPGKGIGLVATRPIRAGQLVMSRTPAVMVDGKAFEGMRNQDLASLIASAVEALPSMHRGRFLNLSTHDAVDNPANRAHKIFSTNAFRTPVGRAKLDLHSTFTEVSRFNHACQPNSVYYFDDTTLSLKVFAAIDIMIGEELTVSYIDFFQPRAQRQARLHEHWGFQCTCDRCTAEPHVAAESDDRVAQILSLWAELDSYEPTSPATPAKAELLVQLFELEGAAGRMHEAFYRAALEWNGVGDVTQAVRYARRCLDRGLRFRGPDRPFLDSMREMLRNPKEHWSWKFRLQGDQGTSVVD